MRSLLVAAVVMLLSLGACSCGASSQKTNSGTTRSTRPKSAKVIVFPGKDSNDLDSDASDGDDDLPITGYGHAATPAELSTIATLVKRYYAAAAADNGPLACSMLLPEIAKALPEEYGGAFGPTYLRGKTCDVVASKLFRHLHHELAGESAGLEVTAVRVEGDMGLAILRFASTPEPRVLLVHLQAGRWKIREIVDGGVP